MEIVKSNLSASDIRASALTFLANKIERLLLSEHQSVQREPVQILHFETEEELASRIRQSAAKLREEHPPARNKLDGLETLVQKVLDSKGASAALGCLREVQQFVGGSSSEARAAHVGTYFTTDETSPANVKLVRQEHEYFGNLHSVLDKEWEDLKFVAAVMQMCAERRAALAPLAPVEELALEHAYRLVASGVKLPRYYEPLRKSSERRHQTYLSFADPGDGHLKVTVRDSSLLDGTIVHIEWIDRDNVDRKDLIEAYRLSSLGRAARVRLQVGAETPCTAFIGRPVFESREPGKPIDGKQFEMSLLKAVHMTASACSAMFANGIIDCKVAMDGMTAKQAVEFMRAVAGNVVREAGTQWLSAAFNVNSPILDDRHGELKNRLYSKPFEIAKLGIELVKRGRFDKIAWDGASDEQPSNPIIGRLSRPELLQLVHLAHQQNLETYISAGMVSEHMKDAVYVGVGGVGIGTSLHHIANAETKQIGEIDPNRVRKALEIRNNAAKDDAGHAARKLAELDWQWSEGSLSLELDRAREQLFEALHHFLNEFDKSIQRLANLNEREALASEEVRNRDQLLREIPIFGKQVPAFQDVLRKIEQLQSTTGQRSRALDEETTQVLIPAEVRRHPLYQRAERVVGAYQSGQGVVGPVQLTPESVAALQRYLNRGELDPIAQLFARANEVPE